MPVRLAQWRRTTEPIAAAIATLPAATANSTTFGSDDAARVGSEKSA